MRILPILALLLTMLACTSSIPSDEELRLAAKSEMRKQKRSEAEQESINGKKITDLHCDGSNNVTSCSFKIDEKAFQKTFARTGSGTWSAYEGQPH